MPKYDISAEEWWPVYTIDAEPTGEFEIPAALAERHMLACKEFAEVQGFLKAIYEASE